MIKEDHLLACATKESVNQFGPRSNTNPLRETCRNRATNSRPLAATTPYLSKSKFSFPKTPESIFQKGFRSLRQLALPSLSGRPFLSKGRQIILAFCRLSSGFAEVFSFEARRQTRIMRCKPDARRRAEFRPNRQTRRKNIRQLTNRSRPVE